MHWKEPATPPCLWSGNPRFFFNELPFLRGKYFCKYLSEISPYQDSLTGLCPQMCLPKTFFWPEERLLVPFLASAVIK